MVRLFGMAALAAAVALVIWLIAAFNRLVRYRNLVREAWSGIDVQLKRRHDLVPALVAAVRGQAQFEQDTLERLMRVRAGTRPTHATRDLQDEENALSAGLRSVLAVVEAYPELRATRGFLDLQRQLVEVESHLQLARRYHNGAVRDLNTAVESFPVNLVAAGLGFRVEAFFQVESATERQAPTVAV